MYESHITVEGISFLSFQDWCLRRGLKAILIGRDSGSSKKTQIMTSTYHPKEIFKETLERVYGIAKAINRDTNGHVVRRKIERVLNPKEPPPSSFSYLHLEFHLSFLVKREAEGRFLREISNRETHTSRNVNKRSPEPGWDWLYVTCRTLQAKANILETAARYLPTDVRLVKTVHEAVVFDDNPDHDDNWYRVDTYSEIEPVETIMAFST